MAIFDVVEEGDLEESWSYVIFRITFSDQSTQFTVSISPRRGSHLYSPQGPQYPTLKAAREAIPQRMREATERSEKYD